MLKFISNNFLKIQHAFNYTSNSSSPFLQSLIKSSIVPLSFFDKNLPKEGVILDLGCGEGILTNLIARIRPNCSIIGLDLDVEKINKANNNALKNTQFLQFDFFNLSEYKDISAIIINDVVHHLDYDLHMRLFILIFNSLKPGGKFFLKEVDKDDFFDYRMTKFFDEKIYPDDKLCFRSKTDWLALFNRLGIQNVSVYKYFHPWQASRTIFSVNIKNNFINPYKLSYDVNQKLINSNKTRIFITGGSGFLGGYLLDYLIKNGLDGNDVEIVCLSRTILKLEQKNINYIYGDLDDVSLYEPIFENIDYIFHLAAEVKLTGAKDLWRNNYFGSIKLIDAAKNKNIKRFIYASTIGAIDRFPSDNCSKPLTESSKPNPLSEYGLTKLNVESYLIKSKVNFSILRVTWGYGKGMTPDTHMRFLCNAAFSKKFFTSINFPGKVSIVSAYDISRAFCFIAVNKKTKNETFFITDGEPISIGNIFQTYLSVIGKTPTIIKFPFIFRIIIKHLRKFLPLSVQNLSIDLLTANPKKLFSLGFEIRTNRRDAFRELAIDLGHYPTSQENKSITIITGAASGIGRALANQLRLRGHNLLLVDINLKGLIQLSSQLNCHYLHIDISKTNFITELDIFLKNHNYSIDWLINNAGIGFKGELDKINIDDVSKMIDINISALTKLSHYFVSKKNKMYKSCLVNIGSSSGYMPLPTMASYAASKAYVQSFTLSLMSEYPDERIFLFDPSGTDTSFQNKAGVRKTINEKLLTPDDVASSIIISVERGKKIQIYGKSGKLLYLISKFLPRQFQHKLMYKLMKKMR